MAIGNLTLPIRVGLLEASPPPNILLPICTIIPGQDPDYLPGCPSKTTSLVSSSTIMSQEFIPITLGLVARLTRTYNVVVDVERLWCLLFIESIYSHHAPGDPQPRPTEDRLEVARLKYNRNETSNMASNYKPQWRRDLDRPLKRLNSGRNRSTALQHPPTHTNIICY